VSIDKVIWQSNLVLASSLGWMMMNLSGWNDMTVWKLRNFEKKLWIQDKTWRTAKVLMLTHMLTFENQKLVKESNKKNKAFWDRLSLFSPSKMILLLRLQCQAEK
jgi:hypothetical protein